MTQSVVQEQARTAGDARMCDQDGCDKLATHAYRWDWGQEGVVCAEHAQLLQQKSEHLNRRVVISTLGPVVAPPLTRDERTQLIAARLSAEAEIDELKNRGADLYRENVDLTKQVQTLTVRGREAEAQLRDAGIQLGRYETQLAESQAEVGELTNEVKRLKTLVKFSEQSQPDQNVVEGR